MNLFTDSAGTDGWGTYCSAKLIGHPPNKAWILHGKNYAIVIAVHTWGPSCQQQKTKNKKQKNLSIVTIKLL